VALLSHGLPRVRDGSSLNRKMSWLRLSRRGASTCVA
jgi:hypothetical protein